MIFEKINHRDFRDISSNQLKLKTKLIDAYNMFK